jgi:hypothetical protein
MRSRTADGELDREFRPVTAEGCHLDASTEDGPFLRLEVARQAPPVGLTLAFGDQEVGQVPADGLVTAPSKHVFGPAAPERDDAGGIHADDRVEMADHR